MPTRKELNKAWGDLTSAIKILSRADVIVWAKEKDGFKTSLSLELKENKTGPKTLIASGLPQEKREKGLRFVTAREFSDPVVDSLYTIVKAILRA